MQLPWSHHNLLFPVLGLSQISWYTCRCRYVTHHYDIVAITMLYLNTMPVYAVVELSTNLELRKVWDHESFPHIELVEKHDGYDTIILVSFSHK